MPAIINSDDGVVSGSSGLKTSGGNDGLLNIQTNGSTAMSINASQQVTFNNGANLPNTFGFKNRIINGGMVIDQRNAGASVTPTSGQYLVDRFYYQATQASKVTAQRNAGSVTLPAGFANYQGITSSSAYSVASGDYFLIRQAVEGFNVADLNWGTASAATVTLSFWVRSSLTGTFGGAFTNASGNRWYPFSYTISSANTWEQKSITIAGDTTGTWATDNTAGIQISWNLGAGSTYSGTAGAWTASTILAPTGATSVVGTNGATFYITGVQLERGSAATSFDFRSYGTELALCQRYFETNYPPGSAVGSSPTAYLNINWNLINPTGGVSYATIQCCVPKRASATYTAYTYDGTSGQWHQGQGGISETKANVTLANGGNTTCLIYLTTTPATTQNTMYGRWTASAEL